MAYIKDRTSWTERGSLFKPSRNADEAELEAIKYGTTPIDTGVVDDVMADEHYSDFNESGAHWEEEDAALEQAVGPVIDEVDRRLSLGGEFYPFQRQGNTLTYTPSKTKVYESCLVTSLQKDLSRSPFNLLTLNFELICTEISRLYLGGEAESFRAGWPPNGDRPKNFRALMHALHERTGEFHWQPKFEIDDDDPLHHIKDEGLDFVAWKHFPDNRAGHIFLLGQCACGQDWETKFTDLEHNRLTQWLNPVTWVDYVRSFAVPHHIPGHQIFSHVCSRAGLTFDRLRLSIIAEMNSSAISCDITEKAIESVRILIPDFLRET